MGSSCPLDQLVDDFPHPLQKQAGSWGPSEALGYSAATVTECIPCPCDFSSPLFPSPSAASSEPSDLLPGAASHHPAAGADGAGPAGADTDGQWHAADPGPGHGADSGCAPGAAGPGRWLAGVPGGHGRRSQPVCDGGWGLHTKQGQQGVREPLVGAGWGH